MVTKRTLKKIDGSAAIVLPKSMLDRFHLQPGDEVFVVEMDNGLLVTPRDSDFGEAMQHFARIAKRYRSALRELAR